MIDRFTIFLVIMVINFYSAFRTVSRTVYKVGTVNPKLFSDSQTSVAVNTPASVASELFL